MMGILNNIWTTLTTSNLELSNYIVIPFTFIEIWMGMLLFTVLLDFNSTKKQKIIYIFFLSFVGIMSNLIIPKPFGFYFNILIWPISIFLIFKVTPLKSVFAVLIPLIFSTIFESILGKIYYTVFDLTYDVLVSIPIYRITIMLTIYACMFSIYKLVQKFSLQLSFKNLHILKNSSNNLFTINFLLGILAIATQSYLMAFYANLLPFPIIILSTISLITYFCISIYSLIKTSQLETTSQRLEETQLYNKTLELLYDNIRAFRHDFNNIMQALGGHIDSNDMEGLRKYFKELNRECIDTNNLNALNPKTINNPAIYSILASKYYKADTVRS